MNKPTSEWRRICLVHFAECNGKYLALSVFHPEIAEFFRTQINSYVNFINDSKYQEYSEKVYVEVIEQLTFLKTLIDTSFSVDVSKTTEYIDKISKKFKKHENQNDQSK